jgi:mono/diheme cytochrome c family protein
MHCCSTPLRSIRAASGAAFLLVIPLLASAQDVGRGQRLAQTWCANCHVVDRDPAQASATGLPTFPALAVQEGQTPERLRAAMNPQHSRMPDLQLSEQQQDDLVAYIFSLKQRR